MVNYIILGSRTNLTESQIESFKWFIFKYLLVKVLPETGYHLNNLFLCSLPRSLLAVNATFFVFFLKKEKKRNAILTSEA